MGKIHPQLSDKMIHFIKEQKIFFVATVPNQGRINLSPKGLDSFRCLNPQQALFLNLTGSGNETAAHLKQDPRITIMFCSFDTNPLILRIYGQGTAIHQHDDNWQEYASHFPHLQGKRQLILITIDSVHTSCGAGVPLFNYQGERSELPNWFEKKGPDGIRDYWQKNNRISLDGADTGIFG
ncbi:pyridoxamine 5'-phosphate oxidase family protein [Magnetococcales bacterium HHB-1]